MREKKSVKSEKEFIKVKKHFHVICSFLIRTPVAVVACFRRGPCGRASPGKGPGWEFMKGMAEWEQQVIAYCHFAVLRTFEGTVLPKSLGSGLSKDSAGTVASGK